MAEGRRFLLALTLVGSCVAIAGVFVATAPPVALPATQGVAPRRQAVADALPRLPLPPWHAAPAPRQHPPAPRTPARGAPALGRAVAATPMPQLVASVAASGEAPLVVPSLPAPALAPLSLATAPVPVPANAGRPAAATAAQPATHGDRDPLTGAFVSVGVHVGKGARTVGRTLRNLF